MWVQQGFKYNFIFVNSTLVKTNFSPTFFFVKNVLVKKFCTKKYWFKIFGQKNLGSIWSCPVQHNIARLSLKLNFISNISLKFD